MAIKGSVIRPLPEWWNQRCATGFGYAAGDGTNTYFVGLYNNATDGSTLWLYGYSHGDQIDNENVVFYMQQGPNGTLQNAGIPVRSDVATLPGQILVGIDNNWFNETAGWGVTREFGYDFSAFTPYPLAIITAGFQLNVTPQAATASMGVGFYWAAMPPGQI